MPAGPLKRIPAWFGQAFAGPEMMQVGGTVQQSGAAPEMFAEHAVGNKGSGHGPPVSIAISTL